MLRIDAHYLESVLSAESAADLFEPLQKAIELEHSTIPPYLTAMISLKPRQNREIWELIHSVVVEEMLHMTIAANVLNALGGSPAINQPEFIPRYPTALPMNIGGGFKVGLEKYSKEVVKRVFMEIEEPEEPLQFPVLEAMAPEFATIGQFYQAIQKQIRQLAYADLPGDPGRQVVNGDFFTAQELFPIRAKEDAVRAIDIIIEQGEGTPESPVDPEGELAHYYRFEELYVGRRLVKDDRVKQGYSYSGDPVPLDEQGISPLKANTKSADLPEGSEERRQADQFNFVYGKLLNGLHRTFNGDPGFLDATLGLMFDLKLIGETLAAMEYPGQPGSTIGPPFEYVNVNR